MFITRARDARQWRYLMRHTLRFAVGGVALLFIAGPAFAHHPFDSEFDSQAPLTLSGAVTRVDWSEPHVYVHVDVKDPSGQTRTWNFELASPAMLARKGWSKDSLKQGETVTVKGYRAKSDPFVATARMIEMPNGKQLSSADEDDGGPKQ
jgi:hypothetical protein